MISSLDDDMEIGPSDDVMELKICWITDFFFSNCTFQPDPLSEYLQLKSF